MAFELIALGASWGGMRALASVLEALPADFELPVVVAQHRPPRGGDEMLERVLGTQLEAPGRPGARQGAARARARCTSRRPTTT